MPLGKLFHNQLIPIMSMESVSLMEHLVTTSGPMLLVYQKEIMVPTNTIVHAATPTILIMYSHKILLEITTTVKQVIQQINGLITVCTLTTHSGMVSSVKVSVAAMENLLRGSVWNYQTQQLTIIIEVHICKGGEPGDDTPIQLRCWNYTTNK